MGVAQSRQPQAKNFFAFARGESLREEEAEGKHKEKGRRNAGTPGMQCGSGMGMNEDERHPQPPTEV